MSTATDAQFATWKKQIVKLKHYLYHNPTNLKPLLWSNNGIWINEKDCPVDEGYHNASFNSECARISALTSQYQVGNPRKKTIEQGFSVETGIHYQRYLILKCFQTTNYRFQVTNLGPTWYLEADPHTRRILIQVILFDILQNTALEGLIPEIITAYQCSNKRCVLMEHYPGQALSWDSDIESESRQLVKVQLEALYAILAPFQWFDAELADNLVLIPRPGETIEFEWNNNQYQGAYKLQYTPGIKSEIKINLKDGSDLFIAPWRESQALFSKIDKQKHQMLNI